MGTEDPSPPNADDEPLPKLQKRGRTAVILIIAGVLGAIVIVAVGVMIGDQPPPKRPAPLTYPIKVSTVAATVPEPPPPPEPPPEPKKVKPKGPDPRKAIEDDLRRLRAELEGALSRRGLYMPDVQHLPSFVSPLDQWRAALGSSDVPRAKDTLAVLLPLIEKVPIDKPLMEKKLRRVSDHMTRAEAILPAPELAQFRTRFNELSNKASFADSEADRIALATAIEQLNDSILSKERSYKPSVAP